MGNSIAMGTVQPSTDQHSILTAEPSGAWKGCTGCAYCENASD